MVLEVAVLKVRDGQELEFEQAFRTARNIISSSPGHLGNELHRCLENPGQYLLLVCWSRLEDHTEGFRRSPAYAQWKELLHHFYDPFPSVEHYVDVP